MAEEKTKKEPKEKPEDDSKEPEDFSEESDGSGSFGGDLLSPAGIVMLSLALMFDIFVGLVVFVLHFFFIGPFVSWFFHLMGFLFFGTWIFFRSGRITRKNGLMKKVVKKIIKRGGLAWIVSSIPILGDLVPCWTIAVYYELKNG